MILAALACLFVLAAILCWLIWETTMALTFDDDFDDDDEDIVGDDA